LNERSPQRLGCLIVDEHPVVREGLRQVLRSIEELIIAGEAATPEAATDLARRLQPTLVLIGLPGEVGRETGRAVRLASSRSVIVSFPPTGEEPDPAAHGSVARAAERGAILAVIRRALDAADRRSSRRTRAERSISPREREVLELLAEGLSNRQISDRLVVSLETIKTHVRNILAKLGAESRAQAVATGLRDGLIR
jgi:DNA-binding NarL/FixJ family response regulator